jgi:ABC-type uncharacterized transport system substrate-binding protein
MPVADPGVAFFLYGMQKENMMISQRHGPLISKKAVIRLLLCLGLLATLTCIAITDKSSRASSAADKKKVLYVNSYHPGYEWSDGITRSICKVFGARIRNGGDIDNSKSGVRLKVVYVDTKRKHGEAQKIDAGRRAKHIIDSWAPDLVITSDDNAAKYLIVPFFRNTAMPFVFCGINWDSSEYGLPCKNVTGMVEVQLIGQIVSTLKRYARGNRIAYIKGDDFSARKEARFYEQHFHLSLDMRFVKTFAQWKAAYIDLQHTSEMILVGNSASIEGWQAKAAKTLVDQQTLVPTGNWDAWMAPFALITFATNPEEQGRWAATTALKILSGTPPSQIPVVTNKAARVILNMPLAKKLGIRFPMELIDRATFTTE